MDTVCSLGAVPFYGDAWGVDCMYSGSQKVISAPPGLPATHCDLCSAFLDSEIDVCREEISGYLNSLCVTQALLPSC